MTDAAIPTDTAGKNPDPRGPLGDARPGDEKADNRTKGSLPQERVEDRPAVSTVVPEDYPAKDREASKPGPRKS